jgi:hypothetical protein
MNISIPRTSPLRRPEAGCNLACCPGREGGQAASCQDRRQADRTAPDQAEYIGIKPESPFKGDHYRY